MLPRHLVPCGMLFFTNTNLSLTTKRQVYQACVLSVLQYGGECWILLRKNLKRLNAFHHRCIHTVLGITNMRQWEERITSRKTREQWGDQETITVKLMKRHLEWLGHLARMLDHHIPKKTLFSTSPTTPTWRTKEEVERSCEERYEGCTDQ